MFRIGSGYKNNIIETGSSEFKNLKSYYICAPDFAGRLWKSLLVTDILQLQHQPKMKFKEVHILNERSNYEQSEKIEQSLPSGLVPSWEVSLRLLRPKNIHIKQLYGDSPKNHIICRRRREKEIDNCSFTCSLPQVELESC